MKGNGCKQYNDCFTCPFSDCILGNVNVERQKEWREKNKERLRLYQIEYRERKKNEQNNCAV